MLPVQFNLRKLAIALGLGFSLVCQTPAANAGGLRSVGGSLASGGQQLGGRLSSGSQNLSRGAGNFVGGVSRQAGNAYNSTRRQASQAGMTLGNTVPVRPSAPQVRNPIPPAVRNLSRPAGAVMNQGGQALSQARQAVTSAPATANQAFNGPAFQRTVVNPMPVMPNPRQMRSDLNAARTVSDAAMGGVVTNFRDGHREAGRIFEQSRRDVTRAAGRMVRGNGNVVEGPFGPPARNRQQSEPGISVGTAQAVPVPPRPVPNGTSTSASSSTSSSNSNRTAETLAGVAAVIGAVAVAAESADDAYFQTDEEGYYPAYDADGLEIAPVEVEGPSEMQFESADECCEPVGTDAAAGAAAQFPSIAIYNPGPRSQKFHVAAPGESESFELRAGEAVELDAASIVVTFTAGGQERRFTLSANKAYKFATGSDGLTNLFSFNRAELGQ